MSRVFGRCSEHLVIPTTQVQEESTTAMSDTYNLNTSDLFIQTLVERWMELNKDVEGIDEKMDVESYGKTKLLNSVFGDVGGLDSDKNILANSVRNFMNSENVDTEEKFVGFYETLRRIIKEWDDRVDKFVKENTKTIPDSEKPSDTEIEDMRKDRKTAVDAMNGIRGLLEGTAPDWFKTEGNDLLPTKINKRGAVGGRDKLGKRLGGKFQFRVNGTILSENKLSAIVTQLKGKVGSVKEVREAIEAQIE